ncbi:hypothetical protein BpHYR1_015804 [Brachionus plicatilis]|uniref:Uncharacterized protein n=1 Tax=Brachionus plicatilis TaxID=10195 RepID=A0A3M7SY15_BRAPC|nr:hypothetical protein BpHYR1_015804 [Brachionus plicatilis]
MFLSFPGTGARKGNIVGTAIEPASRNGKKFKFEFLLLFLTIIILSILLLGNLIFTRNEVYELHIENGKFTFIYM